MATGDDDHNDADVPVARRPRNWLIVSVVVAVLAVVFITQNRDEVTVDFVIFRGEARTWVVILIAMVLGGVLTELVRIALKRRRAAN